MSLSGPRTNFTRVTFATRLPLARTNSAVEPFNASSCSAVTEHSTERPTLPGFFWAGAGTAIRSTASPNRTQLLIVAPRCRSEGWRRIGGSLTLPTGWVTCPSLTTAELELPGLLQPRERFRGVGWGILDPSSRPRSEILFVSGGGAMVDVDRFSTIRCNWCSVRLSKTVQLRDYRCPRGNHDAGPSSSSAVTRSSGPIHPTESSSAFSRRSICRRFDPWRSGGGSWR